MAGTPRVSIYLGSGACADALRARVQAAGTSLSSYVCDALVLAAAAADAGFFVGPGGELLCRPGAAGAVAAASVPAPAPSPPPPRQAAAPRLRRGVPGGAVTPGSAAVPPAAAQGEDSPAEARGPAPAAAAAQAADADGQWPELGTLLQGWD